MPKFPAFAIVLTTLGCTKEPEVDYCLEAKTHEPSITLGTGGNEFEPIEEGELLKPVWGPQGGHHIWASFQAVGIKPGQGEIDSPHTWEIDGGYTALVPEGNDPVMITLEVSFPDHDIGPYQGTYTTFAYGTTAASWVTGLTAIIDLYDIVDRYPDDEEIAANMWISVVDGCETVVSDRKDFRMQLTDIDGIYSYDY